MTHDPTQPSELNLHDSPLAQRLQRRSLESGGVINLRQLPIEQIHTTIHRMMQRDRLPNQIESRYRTVGALSLLELPGRSRVENLAQGIPTLVTPPLPPTLQRAAFSMESTPVPPATISPSSTETFRVSHKPAPEVIAAPIAPTPIETSSAVPDSAGAASDPPPTETVTESAAAPERVRVQHPITATLMRREVPDTPLVVAEPRSGITAEPSTLRLIGTTQPIETVPTASEHLARQPDSPEQPTSFQAEAPPSSVTVPVAVTANSKAPAPLPLVIARSPAASPTEETMSTSAAEGARQSEGTADTPRVQAASGRISRSPRVPVTTTAISQPLVIARLAATPQSSSENPLLQNKRSAPVETRSAMLSPLLRISQQSSESMPTAMPIQATTVMIQSLAQLNSEPGVISVMRRQSAPEPIARSPLPLHIQLPPGTIVRQTEPTMVGEAVSTQATPPPPSPPEKSATEPGPDVKQIAEQVSALLMRQLTVERERRGMQRW